MLRAPGMLRDFASPQSVGGSPASWVDHSGWDGACWTDEDPMDCGVWFFGGMIRKTRNT